MRVKNILTAMLFGLLFSVIFYLSNYQQAVQIIEDLVLKESNYSTMPAPPLALIEPLYMLFAMIIFSIISLSQKSFKRVMFFWFVTGIAIFSTQLSKFLLPRQDLLTEGLPSVQNTMPSGHMSIFAAIFIFFIVNTNAQAKKLVVWAASCISMIAAAQIMYYGWHRPSDLIAAYILTLAVFFIFEAFLPPSFNTESRFLPERINIFFKALTIIFIFAFLAVTVSWVLYLIVQASYAQAAANALIAAVTALSYQTAAALKQC